MSSRGKGYFKGKEISFDLPVDWNLLAMAEPKEMCGLGDVEAKVRESLAHPIGMSPLADVVAQLPHKKTSWATESVL